MASMYLRSISARVGRSGTTRSASGFSAQTLRQVTAVTIIVNGHQLKFSFISLLHKIMQAVKIITEQE